MASLLMDRVAAGVQHLDERSPDWWKPGLIDLDELNIANPRKCVLGQLEGSYFDALGERGWYHIDAARHGFYSFEVFDTYKGLTDAWREVITERRRLALAA